MSTEYAVELLTYNKCVTRTVLHDLIRDHRGSMDNRNYINFSINLKIRMELRNTGFC